MQPPYRAYDNDSVEIDPEAEVFSWHLSRYWWASQYAVGADVLDCACGKGYGTFVLASGARSVTGVDLNPTSLDIARSTFRRPNIIFLAQNVLELHRLKRQFDLITAFEIIEHVPAELTDTFLRSLAACLKPAAKLLLSTPNHDVVTRSGVAIPEYHVNNFTPRALRRILRRHFSRVTMLGQYYVRSSLYHLAFSLDLLNLRHSFGGPVKRLLAEYLQCADLASVRSLVGDPSPGSGPRCRKEYFEHPPEDYGRYRFSPWHWRQSGITVASCEGPAEVSSPSDS